MGQGLANPGSLACLLGSAMDSLWAKIGQTLPTLWYMVSYHGWEFHTSMPWTHKPLQLIKPCPLSSSWSPWRLGISHFPFPSRVFWASFKRKLPYVVYSFILKKEKCIYIITALFRNYFSYKYWTLKTFQQILCHPLSGYYCEVIYGGGFMWGLKSGLPRLVKSAFISKEFVQT